MRQILLLLFISTVAIFSQDLDRLSIRERNKILREKQEKQFSNMDPVITGNIRNSLLKKKKY